MRIPVAMDLALHAIPALSLLLDFYIFETKFSSYEVNRRATVIAATWCVWYSAWVEYCASYNGHCELFIYSAVNHCSNTLSGCTVPYPFLTENPFPVRCGIYCGAMVLALGAFRIINSLHA
jgi:hypothetical protein